MGKLFGGYPNDTSPTLTDSVPTLDAETGLNKKSTLANILALFFGTGSLPTDYRNGWISLSGIATLSYTSWDSTNKTGVMATSADLTGYIGVGDRVRIVQATGGTKYFIVHAITASSITGYFGTDYTLNNEAVSTPFYSGLKAPLGFPLDPAKWSVTATDSTDRNFTTTTLASLTAAITLPIGIWAVTFRGQNQLTTGGVAGKSSLITLSSDGTTETNTSLTSYLTEVNLSILLGVTFNLTDTISVAAATTMTALGKVTSTTNAPTGTLAGSSVTPTKLKAVDAYL